MAAAATSSWAGVEAHASPGVLACRLAVGGGRRMRVACSREAQRPSRRMGCERLLCAAPTKPSRRGTESRERLRPTSAARRLIEAGPRGSQVCNKPVPVGSAGAAFCGVKACMRQVASEACSPHSCWGRQQAGQHRYERPSAARRVPALLAGHIPFLCEPSHLSTQAGAAAPSPARQPSSSCAALSCAALSSWWLLLPAAAHANRQR